MALFGLLKADPLKQAAIAIYGIVGDQARAPWFYTQGKVPDTFDGRFDMLVLQLHLAVRRLRSVSADPKVAQQRLFDVFMRDLDQGLRLEGVGDIGIGHRVKKMTHAYYGRAVAYDAALDAGDHGLMQQALHRNLYRLAPVDDGVLDAMTAYVFAQEAFLQALDEQTLLAGTFRLALPDDIRRDVP